MFQLPIPTFDSERSKGAAELGQLPDWNLNDLYTSTDAKELVCLLYTSPSPRDRQKSRMPSSA